MVADNPKVPKIIDNIIYIFASILMFIGKSIGYILFALIWFYATPITGSIGIVGSVDAMLSEEENKIYGLIMLILILSQWGIYLSCLP